MSTVDSLPYILPELLLTATVLILFIGDLLIRRLNRLRLDRLAVIHAQAGRLLAHQGADKPQS